MRLCQPFSLIGAAAVYNAGASSLGRRQNTCAEVSRSASAALASNPTSVPVISGQLAYDCLNSVPIKKQKALQLIDSILPYLEWQSDPTYLKNPPTGYLEPAVDLKAEFQTIRTKINRGIYPNKYKFQADLFRVFGLPHDGHFRFGPDLLTKVIYFELPVGLVSVSLNGADIPEIYVQDDVVAMEAGQFMPSAVSKINNQDAVEYLKGFAQRGRLQDPDALYNSLLFSKPGAAAAENWNGGFSKAAFYSNIYRGPSTTITFTNLTSNVYYSIGHVLGDFTGVSDGESAYKKFCMPSQIPSASVPVTPNKMTAAVPRASSVAVPNPISSALGYPTPIVISSDNIVSGYYLDSTQNSDVAVLSILSFEPETPAEFQAAVQSFIADAVTAGKTKLIIDVSSNGGGYVFQGIDTFRQLFPQIVQKGYTRFRNNPAFNAIIKQFAEAIPADYNPAIASADLIHMYESSLNYRSDIDINGNKFASPEAKYGPFIFNGDKYTNLIQWDMNNPMNPNITFGFGAEITGYGSRRHFTQPFDSMNIVLLSDGHCASTCTIFSELMRRQGGVKSIAIGGRPSKDPMQSVGGVKGANNYSFKDIKFLASIAYKSATLDQRKQIDWSSLKKLTDLAIQRSSDTSVNVRDNILPQEVAQAIPAQFLYEKADCRLFYEPAMVIDVTNIWEAAADAAWGSKMCVEGGLNLPKRIIPKISPHSVKSRASNDIPRSMVSRFKNTKFEPPLKDIWWRIRYGTKTLA